MFLLVYVKVGETEKIDITGNVDTINFPRNVGTISLMLFLVPIDKFTSKINLGDWVLPKISFYFETENVCSKLTSKFVPTCYACQFETNLVKGGFLMTEWKTLKEVAEELGISKDLVKYHRKNLDIFQIERENGVYRVSPSGVEEIRSHLRKESYDATFEEKVMRRLHMIENQQEVIYSLLLKVLNERK
nr:hypothetical protein [Streptococcus anginosus]BBC53695.1 hypothetical protein [Streptococcus anginosus subsp. anginosus]